MYTVCILCVYCRPPRSAWPAQRQSTRQGQNSCTCHIPARPGRPTTVRLPLRKHNGYPKTRQLTERISQARHAPGRTPELLSIKASSVSGHAQGCPAPYPQIQCWCSFRSSDLRNCFHEVAMLRGPGPGGRTVNIETWGVGAP